MPTPHTIPASAAPDVHRPRRASSAGILLLFALLVALVAFIIPRLGEHEASYDSPSFYQREIRKSGLDVEGMQPYMLSPLATDVRSEHCPDQCEILATQGMHAHIRPYVEAIGGLALPQARETLSREIASALHREWQTIRQAAQEAPRSPPLRVLVNHYARKRDPGHCVTIRATFSTAPDPLFDHEAAQALDLPGVLYMFWKTYQLSGDEPKLIEAGVEVTTQVKSFGWRRDFATIAEPEQLPQTWTRDELAGGHFYGFGGGVRYGMTWIDRGAGTKAASPWGAAYRIEHLVESGKPKVEMVALPGAWKAPLLELIQKL